MLYYFAAPKPGYGLGNKGKSATLPASTGRARSFDPYVSTTP